MLTSNVSMKVDTHNALTANADFIIFISRYLNISDINMFSVQMNPSINSLSPKTRKSQNKHKHIFIKNILLQAYMKIAHLFIVVLVIDL